MVVAVGMVKDHRSALEVWHYLDIETEREVLKITPRLMAWTSDWMIVAPNEKSHVEIIARKNKNV